MALVSKAAELRAVFRGKPHLIDYNWSIKMVTGSDQIRKISLYLVQVEFLLMDEKGRHKRHVAEFDQEEFVRFNQSLQQLVSRI